MGYRYKKDMMLVIGSQLIHCFLDHKLKEGMTMGLTFTQCKQLKANGYNLHDFMSTLKNKPDWIEYEFNIADLHAIQQGGCASGAYMPAVTYSIAAETMAEHGDDVLDFIQDHLGELPQPPADESWSGLAVFYLSLAVELWAAGFDLDHVDWD